MHTFCIACGAVLRRTPHETQDSKLYYNPIKKLQVNAREMGPVLLVTYDIWHDLLHLGSNEILCSVGEMVHSQMCIFSRTVSRFGQIWRLQGS